MPSTIALMKTTGMMTGALNNRRSTRLRQSSAAIPRKTQPVACLDHDYLSGDIDYLVDNVLAYNSKVQLCAV